MNLAIQHLQQQIKVTEVQLEQALAAQKANQRVCDENAERISQLSALLADLRAAVTALPREVGDVIFAPLGEAAKALKRKRA